MLKKKYLLFILIISIFLISAVSAEDINSSDEITSIDDVNLIKKDIEVDNNILTKNVF